VVAVSFAVEVFKDDGWEDEAAERVASGLPAAGAVILTGGDAARRLYPGLATLRRDWSRLEVLFSDERMVPPDDDASNYGMAKRLLFDLRPPQTVHRMHGEDPPESAARAYTLVARSALGRGIDVAVLGMGPDAHIAALFPGSAALEEREPGAVSVPRPDGRTGVTLTPAVFLATRRVFLVIAGQDKAGAVARAVRGAEQPNECPVRLLAAHPDTTMLLDEAAAALL
jgi:6-phosphogluconolactonase